MLTDPGARLRGGDRAGREEVGPGRQQEPQEGAAEPCDAVEAAVVGVYEELLGVRPVGVDDDLFHLGGHSLLAVQLIARVGALFHLELPVSVLFDAADDDASEGATPRHLAGVVRNTPGGTGPENSPAGRPRSSLVALRRGDGPALFCIPPAGGDVTGFRDLVRTLPEGFAVYGLQHPAADGVQEPNVERLAATCLDEIRTVLPRGPVHVLGWSRGGLVAFEVAARSSTLGEVMATITLVESYPAEYLPAYDSFGIVTGVAEELDRLAGRPVVTGLEELREKPVDAGIDALFRQAETNGVLLAEQERKTLQQQLILLRAHVRAAQEYRLGSYDGPVTLIQAADEERGLREQSAQLWQRASRGRFERHTLPGGHFSLMREPHVRAVSRILQKSRASVVLPAENVPTGDAPR
ncbi:alpha/beta fold hydrolase [Streptomyces echinatus]|uniref:alpha/beta fold hydrolase n=1 Tax=Streptomyces echinatus TaxID=67293 RepID=UPI00378D7CB7